MTPLRLVYTFAVDSFDDITYPSLGDVRSIRDDIDHRVRALLGAMIQ